jgi:hypothetical protein
MSPSTAPGSGAKGGLSQLRVSGGPNPTDRGRVGTKQHLVRDAVGTPLGMTLNPADYRDSRMLTSPLNGAPPVQSRPSRPRRRSNKLRVDSIGNDRAAPSAQVALTSMARQRQPTANLHQLDTLACTGNPAFINSAG